MAIYYGDGSNSSSGRIVKMHKGEMTSKASTSSQNYDIFDVNITPQAAGNWFYIHTNAYISHSVSQSMYCQILIDNVYVGGRVGNNSNSSNTLSYFTESHANNHRSYAAYNEYIAEYVHIHSSASAFNFKFRTRLQGGTQYINYAASYDDADRGKPACRYHILEMEPS